VWAYTGTAQKFLAAPINLGTGIATEYGLQIWQVYNHRMNPNKSPLKILEKRERRHIQGLANFWVPTIISETDKATDFEFCTRIHKVNQTKSP